MKNVLVLFGGASSEHDVSTVSACSVLKHIPAEKYAIYMMGITKEGQWYLYEGDVEALPDDGWLTSGTRTPAFVSPDRGIHGITVLREGGYENIRIDIAFPVLHGKNGEDGTIQGLFQLAGIPFVGCDMTSSAVSLDKVFTNTVADANGVPQAAWDSITAYEFETGAKTLDEVAEKLGYPIFVKPANAGSSVGISKCDRRGDVIDAVRFAADHDRKIVVEENIIGQEVEVAVLGNDAPIASVVGEIIPAADWYDYDAKYNDEASKLLIPANLSEETSELIRKRAIQAYKMLGCSGLARIDFLVRKSDGQPMLNEPNTLPGFTEISMYPKLFEASGIGKTELIDRLISLAIERTEKNR